MMNRIVGIGLLTVVLAGCDKPSGDGEEAHTRANAEVEMVVDRVTLTVAESKRLIAKGLAMYAPVREKMDAGVVIVCRGSSNTYLAEELLQTNFLHGVFLTGRIQPEGSAPLLVKTSIGEIVIRNGVYEPDTKLIAGLKSMRPGDIVFKGANLVNVSDRTAAV